MKLVHFRRFIFNNLKRQVTANIFKLPYASKLDIAVEDAMGEKSYNTEVTFGKEMHNDPFGSTEIIFTSDGTNPVTLNITDPDREKGIWLNAFDLGEWYD